MGSFLCPRCQRLHQEPDARVGEVITCAGCQSRVRVPARRNRPGDFSLKTQSFPPRGRDADEASYRLASDSEPVYSSPGGNRRNGDISAPPVRVVKQRNPMLTGLTVLALLAAAATGAVYYFEKTDEVSRWIAEAKTWIEKTWNEQVNATKPALELNRADFNNSDGKPAAQADAGSPEESNVVDQSEPNSILDAPPPLDTPPPDSKTDQQQ